MSNYHIKHLEEYYQVYRKSIREPENFWEEIAEEHFIWRKKWDKVLEWDFTKPEIKWFGGAQLNITENCIDRHLATRANKTAILFEPNNPDEAAEHITYQELSERVNQFANVLKANSVGKGDRVCIYVPMIPELAIATLACARIGAIHSVVFAGFSSTALATRINDSDCKMVITSDGSYRGKKTIDLKGIVDEALTSCLSVETVLVAKRINSDINMKEGRDKWLQPLLDKASKECIAETMDAEDPLFILYTSGSTGMPKGMVHTTAGYMVYTAYTFKNAFQYRENDVYWCTAVGMRISILQSTTTGTAVYVETHSPTSNENGLVSIEIGTGNTSGDFSTIDWSAGPYFIKTETDPTGGSNYTISGTSQLMSVPFALHAKVAESVSSPVYSIGHSPELGGYVFMVSADGKHGLVCETIDQGGSTWYNAQNVISNPSKHSDDGKNFTDWRVPSRYELAQMYSLKSDIEAVGDSFGTRTYWTSNQSVYSVNGLSEETAWRQNFATGLQYDNNNISLDSELFVRSVREF